MIIKEIQAKAILSTSQVYDYVINPYIGCQHGCSFCYARFMKRFSKHKEAWGDFVDVKINAPELLLEEINRKKKGNVWISGVCDPYQPLEEKYKLTRHCLEILIRYHWPVFIQTRSPLVMRDTDIFRQSRDCEVGLSISTADDSIRKIFEPHAPVTEKRIKALDELHKSGIRTYAMIAPILQGAEFLPQELAGKVDYLLVDRMNYNYADSIFRKNKMEDKLSDAYFYQTSRRIENECKKLGIDCRIVF